VADLTAHLRPVLTVLRAVVDVVLRWVLWMSATVLGCAGGVVFVFTVAGTYGPKTGILVTLSIAAVAVVSLAVFAIRRDKLHLNSSRHAARTPRGNR
jgi:hypothetical protein